MRDELFDRDYQMARDEMNASIADGLDHLGRSLMLAFRALSAIQFDAPWQRQSKPDPTRCA